jgi:imidazolonepropionase
MRTLLHNIGQLVVVPPGPVSGERFSAPPVIADAALVVEDGRIAWFGPKGERPEGPFDETMDAGGGCVTPGLVDCHTHAVFVGSREGEFVQRIQGKTYLEIMQAGGGIRSTMRAVREASVQDLVDESLPRIQRMIAGGVTTLEIKSGYGLTLDDESKMLQAVREIAAQVPIEIIATYLGAHAVPEEFENRHDEYVEHRAYEKYLRLLVRGGSAEFADVFCERGAFTVDQSRRFLSACKDAGLTPKIHAEQITHSGGTRMAVELGAASADHLECVNDEDIAALKGSKTIPVLLPGCSFFLNSPPAPARKMIDAGLPVALATDCNPGSSMIESLPMIMSIACTMLRMTPVECLVACTANAAAALRRADRIGAIAVGHQADLLVLDVPSIDAWPYRVGVNPVRTIFKNGVRLTV